MNQTIKTKKNLKLRKVGPHYMIVNADGGQVNMTQVFKLNQTAALLWEKLSEKEVTPQELADYLCSCFDITPETALTDITVQLAEWKTYGLIES